MNKFVVPFLVCAASVTQAQLKFGGGGSSSSSSGSSSSNNKQSGDNKDVDTRFISTGSELIDGGILGVGAGLLGGAVLSGAFNQPTIIHVAEGDGDKLMVKMEVTPDSSFPILEVVVDVIVEEGKEDKLLMKMMLEQDFLA